MYLTSSAGVANENPPSLSGWLAFSDGVDAWWFGMRKSTPLELQKWYHIVNVIDLDIGQTWYINGVKDVSTSISDKESTGDKSDECIHRIFGAKSQHGNFAANVALDELKYTYRSLTDEGKATSPFLFVPICISTVFNRM